MNGAADKSRSYNQCMKHTRFTYVIILFNRMLMFVKIDSTPSNGSRFSAKKPQNSIMIINFELHRAQAFFLRSRVCSSCNFWEKTARAWRAIITFKIDRLPKKNIDKLSVLLSFINGTYVNRVMHKISMSTQIWGTISVLTTKCKTVTLTVLTVSYSFSVHVFESKPGVHRSISGPLNSPDWFGI